MNNTALLLGSLLAFAATRYTDLSEEFKAWDDYKLQWGKQYESKDEDNMRKLVFAQNKQRVDAFNDQFSERPEEERLFELGLNHLADKSQLEMKQMNGFRWPRNELTGELNSIRNSDHSQRFLNAILEDNSTNIPDAIDWREVPNRVSPVKNQGACGSCWAFASTGCLEGQELGVHGKSAGFNGSSLVQLSEQNLVDCVKKDAGCNGGFMKDALDFVAEEDGIDDEKSYPYEARTRKCRFNPDKVAFSDQGGAILPTGDEEALKKVVATYGPVSVGIDASSIWFSLYKHGVYYNKHCKNKENQLDHGVLVVGYGTDPKKGDYWIVKNSWGPSYGEKGYIRMARNKKNNCGIATAATIATF